MSKSAEDYLDHLLRDATGIGLDMEEAEKSENIGNAQGVIDFNKEPVRTEEDFLDDFERELLGESKGSDSFLKEFEKELLGESQPDINMSMESFDLDDMMVNTMDSNPDDMFAEMSNSEAKSDVFDLGAEPESMPEEFDLGAEPESMSEEIDLEADPELGMDIPDLDSGDSSTSEGVSLTDDFDFSALDLGSDEGMPDLSSDSSDEISGLTDDFDFSALEENTSDEIGAEDMSETSLQEDDILDLGTSTADESANDGFDLDSMDFSNLDFSDESDEDAEDTASEDDVAIDEDLMALLNEESDFSAFSENGDSFGSDGIQSVSEEEFENMLAAENGKGNEASNGKKDKSEKENGFLAKMGKFFFGEDEEEEDPKKAKKQVDSDVHTATAIEDISDENLQLLKELGGMEMTATAETPAEDDKDKKGKKKKDKKEKKEKKEKPKKEKKPKPKKEKKPKPPKEPDRTPPLPKVPVILIFIMAGSILALVLLGTNLLGYSNAVARAENCYFEGDYSEAYAQVSGLEIKEDDFMDYKKYEIMAYAESEYEAYQSLYSVELYDMALDALIRTIGRCEKYAPDAEVYYCVDELANLQLQASDELQKVFGLSMENALELYACEEREEYSVRIQQILKEAGLEKVTEE